MNKNPKIQIALFSLIVISALLLVGIIVISIDPFFHYHAPLTDYFFYTLNNERSQDDGIVKHFDYNAVVTGTSMTENFKVSEVNNLFGVNAVKVPVSGATYSEVNSIIKTALQHNPKIKMIIRGLDIASSYFYNEASRENLGKYPYYLYDNNVLNDVKYLFNRDIIFRRIYPMLAERNKEKFTPGISSFDLFGSWHDQYSYGKDSVIPNGLPWQENTLSDEQTHFDDKTIAAIKGNIDRNVIFLAKENPDVLFYYFFTPYSAVFWGQLWYSGKLDEQLEFERIVIEQMLPVENIRVFSFNTFLNFTENLNYYKDIAHYGEWVNSMILHWIKNGKGLLTKENYEEHLTELRQLYSGLDYSVLDNQEDYDCDDYLKIELYEELSGVKLKEKKLAKDTLNNGLLKSAELVSEQYNGSDGIACYGTLDREGNDIPLGEYLFQNKYNGLMLKTEELEEGKFLVFWGKKVLENGQPSVFIYDDSGNVLTSLESDYNQLDYEWHQYVMDITDITQEAVIVFHGGYIDDTGHKNSAFIFSDISIMK